MTRDLTCLQRLCCDDPTRTSIATPFAFEGWAVATNGHAACFIRLDEGARGLRITDMCLESMTGAELPGRSLTLAAFREWLRTCPVCNGFGRHACRDCGGMHRCSKCGWKDPVFAQVGPSFYNRNLVSRYLYPFSGDEAVRVALDTADPFSPLYVYGEDWRVLVMPDRAGRWNEGDPEPLVLPSETAPETP